jgi:hypothetical protein
MERETSTLSFGHVHVILDLRTVGFPSTIIIGLRYELKGLEFQFLDIGYHPFRHSPRDPPLASLRTPRNTILSHSCVLGQVVLHSISLNEAIMRKGGD